jgi:cell division protein FtsW
MEPYRLERLASFADPFKDSQDTGWQAVQGLYALASGGWWGVGLGASREKWSYLPNAHTDFILAIIGEELGLVGTLLVVVLFGVLAYGGIRVAQRSADPFGRLVAAALTAWLVGQALINMGAVVGLLPITGIPLPLISFGGSSLMLTMVAIGILLSLAKTEPAAAQVQAARAASRSAHRSATGRRRWSLRRTSKGVKGSKGSKRGRRSAAKDGPVKARASGRGRSGRSGRVSLVGRSGSRESRSGSRVARGRRIGLARLSRGSSKRSRRRQPSR